MKTSNFKFVAVVAAALALAACSVENVEVHGAYGGAMRDTVPPVMPLMYNHAFAAVELPAAAISPDDYVAIYRLSSGKAEDQWWCYLAEDWLVAKVRKAGATPVERNVAAADVLAKESEYFAPPRKDATTSAAGGRSAARETDRTPYRATKALSYRVVTADLWLEHPAHNKAVKTGTVPVTAEVVVNLRTLDVMTGEVLWTGTVSGAATKDVPVNWLSDWWWGDWDDWDGFPPFWHSHWEAGAVTVDAESTSGPAKEPTSPTVPAE